MKSDGMIEQIFKMHQDGHAIRKISRALGISKNTVRRYLRMDPAKEESRDPACLPAIKSGVDHNIPWDAIIGERLKGVTAKQLFEENGPPISYSRFCRLLREKLSRPVKPALPLSHEPGEKVQVDFADGIIIWDRESGKGTKTQLFCGVLPFSSFTFAEFVRDQKIGSFIRAHERMWAYFGGVSRYVVIDNLKAGVVKAHRYDPDVNPTYCDYGNHNHFAVLPARPYTPRDKAAVEAAIGVIQRSFFQQVREQKFYSLDELNRVFRLFLDEFNRRIMPDHGVSRWDRFTVEKDRLNPIPTNRYEMAEWRSAKVHPDCCIQVLKALYSVPYNLVGRVVRVKITDKIIEIFDEETNSVAYHTRKQSFEVSIRDEHLPPSRMQSEDFEVKKAKAKAKAIGTHTAELVELLFIGERPLQNLRRVQGILRLWEGGIGRDALEHAAKQAIQFKRYKLNFFKQCAEKYEATGGRLSLAGAPFRDPATIHLHGG